jgi:hypothetical protein
LENQQLRALVKEMYPNEMWSKKVDRMSDKQVFAVYQRIQNDRDKQKAEHKQEAKQLTLF